MRLRKIISLTVTVAMIMANFAVLSTLTASATVNTATTFVEDFSSYTANDTNANTLQALFADGWYMVNHNNGYNSASSVGKLYQEFVQVKEIDGNKCLQITTPQGKSSNNAYGLGRRFPGQTGSSTSGNWEINFRFKPERFTIGSTTYNDQFYFGLNTLNTSVSETNAQHNIVSGLNGKMYLGYRSYNTIYSSSLTQGTVDSSLEWYDVKVILNCSAQYYSVEIKKNEVLVARRSAISFAGDETIGFFKMSALGISSPARVFVDDISIVPSTRETLIYNEDFDSFTDSEYKAATGMTTGGENENVSGASFFKGYTPWRAYLTANSYGLETDATLSSQVVRLGDDTSTGATEQTGLVYMIAGETLVNPTTEMVRGMVKLGFKFKPSVIGDLGASVNVIASHTEDITSNDNAVFVLLNNSGTPAVRTLNNVPVNLDTSKWYNAEMVFDVINHTVKTTVKDNSTSATVADFSYKRNALTALKGIMFKVTGGSKILMDDVKIEYYLPKPSVNTDNIVLTDKFGDPVVGTSNVTAAVDTIRIPFDTVLNQSTVTPSTILLKDSSNTTIPYTATIDKTSYVIDLNDALLSRNTQYIVTIPSSVSNLFGTALGTNATFTFTTTNALSDIMRISSVSIGGSEVSSLSDITAGSTINVTTKYANSTGENAPCVAIVAFYSGGRMVNLLTANATVTSGDYGTDTSTFAFNVPVDLDMSAIERAAVLLWDGFTDITPYCHSLNFR